ncbi:hypothetical protein RB195_016629 [Necator americanus]|uniref:Uncharacterized protein n=1 Tax=Necator americanus TaxID=51031 RepID=A0ABR1C1F2_NECAM
MLDVTCRLKLSFASQFFIDLRHRDGFSLAFSLFLYISSTPLVIRNCTLRIDVNVLLVKRYLTCYTAQNCCGTHIHINIPAKCFPVFPCSCALFNVIEKSKQMVDILSDYL